MHLLCERLRQAVCERLRHDAVIIVLFPLKFSTEFGDTDTRCHRKRAYIILNASPFRCNEITKTEVRSHKRLFRLLTEVMQRPERFCACRICVNLGILADPVCRKQADDGTCLKPFFSQDDMKQVFSIFKKFTRLLTDFRVV